HDLHPPQEVVSAYHDVAKALEARHRQENKAHGDAIHTMRNAEAQALKRVREAQADAHQKVRQAEAARATFLARLRGRNELSLSEEWRLMCEGGDAVLAGQDPRVVHVEYQRRRAELIALKKSLTDFRLSWEALTRVLSGRDKVIVDSDKVPG